MPNRFFTLLTFFLITYAAELSAQNVEHNGWLFWSHRQEISKKWQFMSDVQFRSADKFDYLTTLLIRPGISYNIFENQTIALGYTYFGTWEEIDGKIMYEPENRIFEQYQIENKIGKVEVTNRFRFEQRFFNQENERFFTQRIRHYIQAQIPFRADSSFKKGLYTAIQNEVFVNVQGQEKLNHKVFDQNRSYLGLGYRFSEKIDIEAGFMFRYMVEEELNVRNNVFQLSIKSSL